MGFSTTSYGQNNKTDYQTPYSQAAKAWDQRIGTTRQQAGHWRIAAPGCLGLAILSTSALVYMSLTRQVAAYVVPVNRVGMPGRIELANGLYRPDTAPIGQKIIDRQLNVQPTITIRTGWLFRVLVNKDMRLKPYRP